MTVKELIYLLKRYPMHLPVKVRGRSMHASRPVADVEMQAMPRPEGVPPEEPLPRVSFVRIVGEEG